MFSYTSKAVAFGAVLVLGGCSYFSDSVWPSLGSDEQVADSSEQIPIQPSQAESTTSTTANTVVGAAVVPPPPPAAPLPGASEVPPASDVGSPPPLGTSQFVLDPVTRFQPTGTFVGQKVETLRGELEGLQNRLNQRNETLQQIRVATNQNAQRYHSTVAAVNARLQLGTTPGNPILISQWNQAQAELDRISVDIAAMNSLANEVAADSSMSAFLLESARATYGLAGAIDADHQQLAVLEDETNRAVVLVDRLLNELSADIARQTSYVSNERRNLTTLSLAVKNGELYGGSLANRAFATATPAVAAAPVAQPSGVAADNRRPLVVIRFDRPNVPYQEALYTAMSKALERRPAAQFGLVAVTPSGGTSAQVALNQSRSRKNAEAVLRTLTDMGLPPDRVSLSATTSGQVATTEVHIHVQ